MTRILVTGAAGGIGRITCPFLREQGHVVVGFDRAEDPGCCDAYVQGGIDDALALRQAMAGCETVIHLAANPGTHSDFLTRLVVPNLIGPWRIYEAASELGVRRVVFASSINAVNGPVAKATLPAPESLEDPGNPYGLTKLWGEHAGRLFHQTRGLQVICARICRFIRSPHGFAWLRDHPEDTEPHTSPEDWKRFLLAALSTAAGFAVVHVQSLPRDGIWRLDYRGGLAAIGYQPKDAFPAGFPADWIGTPPYEKPTSSWPGWGAMQAAVPGRRVLITGAAGLIGRHVGAHLRNQGWITVGLDLRANPGGWPEWIDGSICDRATVDRAIAGCGSVIHLAASPSPETPFDRHLDANYRGLWTVLEAARDHGTKRVVLASSLHVLGGPERAFTPDGGHPISAYGLSKLFAERAGRLFHQLHGLDVIAMRIGWCSDHPGSLRTLLRRGCQGSYLSLRDAGLGFAAALGAPDRGFRIWHAHVDRMGLPEAQNEGWFASDRIEDDLAALEPGSPALRR